MTTKYKIFDDSTVEVFFANTTVADDTKFPCYWARPIIGEVRQVAVVRWTDKHTTYLDNQDGTAMVKLEEGWYPNRTHRDLSVNETFEELYSKRLQPHEWNVYNPVLAAKEQTRLNELAESFYKGNPDYEKIKSLERFINKNKP